MNRLITFLSLKKPFLDGASSLFDFANAQSDDIMFDVSTEQDEWEQVGLDLSVAFAEFSEAY